MTERRIKRIEWRTPRSYGSRVYLSLLIVVGVCLALIALGSWRQGVTGIGVAFLAAAAGRWVISEDHAGMLQVRGRFFDVAWMVFLGVSLLVLAATVPQQG